MQTRISPLRGACVAAFSCLLLATPALRAGADTPPSLRLTRPLEQQVVQRTNRAGGTLALSGELAAPVNRVRALQARLQGAGADGRWVALDSLPAGATRFERRLPAPAGGYYRLEVRLRDGDTDAAMAVVEAVGVGEVFVIAGQSNAANHGEEKQRLRTGRVSAWAQGRWRRADDPQPGASGGGGSFIPPFADAIVERFDVPVGILSVAVGATSVREWLPRGVSFPNPPTLTGQVVQLPDGRWESRGRLFEALGRALQEAGPGGVRAVLWHQGESDANQQDSTRTLPGALYREYLERVIRESRRTAGWEVPWFVAQVSYHTPADPGSPDIRNAQSALWTSGVALAGPDTDALTGDYRDQGGRGVHFSGKGLREHGKRWADLVAAWLVRQGIESRDVTP